MPHHLGPTAMTLCALLSVLTASVTVAQQPKLQSTMARPLLDAQYLAITPNGKRLVVASSNGLDIWDLASGKQVSNPLTKVVNALAVHPNGLQAVAALDFSSELQWVDLETGKKGETWKSPTEGTFNGLVFSPDGTLLAVDQNKSVTLWDVAKRQPGKRFNTLNWARH